MDKYHFGPAVIYLDVFMHYLWTVLCFWKYTVPPSRCWLCCCAPGSSPETECGSARLVPAIVLIGVIRAVARGESHVARARQSPARTRSRDRNPAPERFPRPFFDS
jgi:hypothetical protein